MPDRDFVSPTPHQLRALAHPVRLRMLGLLRVNGPATASSLAQRLGLNSGATSYHLRQLADHGFIEDDHERGNGRERWWRASHSSTRVDEGSAQRTEQEQDEVEAYLQTVVTIYQENMQRAIEEHALLPRQWQDATTFSDYQQRMTPARARELLDKLDAWLTAIPDEDDPEAVNYVVQLGGFPYPGSVTPDPTA